MTRIIAAFGGGAFVLVSLWVGGAILLRARRNGGLPEIVMGTSLFLMGGLGYPLTSVARQAQALSDDVRTGLMIGAHVCMVVGIFSLAYFNFRVFRPESATARAASGCVGCGLLVCFVAQGIDPGYRAGAIDKEGIGLVLITVLGAFAMGWAHIESLRYSLLMRRRVAHGLADAAIADRFRLWAIATGAATVISGSTTVLHALDIDPAASVTGALIIGPLGLVAAAALWLAFVPPEFYARWIVGRSTSG